MKHRDLGRLRRGEIIGGFIWWFMFLIGIPFAAGLAVGLYKVFADVKLAETTELTVINLIVSVINAAALVVIFRRFLAEQLRRLRALGLRLLAALGVHILLYFAVTLIIGMVTSALQQLFAKDYSNANQDAVESILSAKLWVGILMACILAPISEELLNRGLIFGLIHRRSPVLAYIVSMLVFSAIHVAGSVMDQPVMVSVISLITYLGPGFVLARIYERTGTIWSSMLLHCLINSISLLVFLLL